MSTTNEQYFKYGQLATAYTFTRAMREAGVDGNTIVDVNWLAHAMFKEVIDRYTTVILNCPENTRQELAKLEYNDLHTELQAESDRINVEVFGATAEELGYE